MRESSGLRSRRRGVVINYFSLAGLAAVFCVAEYRYWNGYFIASSLLLLIAGIASLYSTYIRTGLWRLSHISAGNLDERELGLMHEAFRHSFAAISAISLLAVAFITLSVRFSFLTLTHRGHYSFGLAMMVLLNYLVHILPASIIAWREKHIFDDEEEEKR